MTRADSSEPSTGTDTDDVDTVLTETEFETMGWPADIDGVDSGVDRVYVISSSPSNTGMLDSKEAQALAFRAIADVGDSEPLMRPVCLHQRWIVSSVLRGEK